MRCEEELTKVKRRIQQSKADSFLGPFGSAVESGSTGGAAGDLGDLHSARAGSASTCAEEVGDGGAEDTSQECVVRPGVEDLDIHRPPIPFPFFPTNYHHVWGSSVGSGVNLSSGEGCDHVYAPTSPNPQNFSGSGHGF